MTKNYVLLISILQLSMPKVCLRKQEQDGNMNGNNGCGNGMGVGTIVRGMGVNGNKKVFLCKILLPTAVQAW